MCPDPQNSARFSKMIDLRGHMPRYTPKMNVFPSISIETPKMCVQTLRTVLISPRRSIWGVICLGLVEKCMFSQLWPFFFWDDQFEGSHAKVYSKNERFPIYLLRNPINVSWKPQNSACFSKMIDLRCHMPRFPQKNEHFPIYLLRKPINVSWNPQNSARFSKMIDLRCHMPRFPLKMNVFPSISWESP